MSKGDGKIIAIKFTEPLLGDVTGNETHFTISGKEYEYVGDVNGELIDTEYEVGSVERYPIQRVWELGGELKLDNIGEVVEIVGWNTDSFGLGNPATGTWGYKFKPDNNCLITKLRIFATETTSTVHLWDVLTQTILATKTFATIAGRWNEIDLDVPMQIYSNKEYIVSANYTKGKNYYRNDSPNQTEFNELTHLGVYLSASHNTFPNASITWGNAVDIIMQISDTEFVTPKIYQSQSISISGEHRISWIENKPTDTTIIAEYTTGETRGEWQAVSNGEVVNANTNLWIKATLSTEDKKVTPTLQDLWIAPTEAPADTIRLIMNDYFRFNNVVGDLTVAYDSAGSLAGADGMVEAFTETFTPTELITKPHQNDQEHIEISNIISTGTLTRVYYTDTASQEHIEITSIAAVGVLTNISDL